MSPFYITYHSLIIISILLSFVALLQGYKRYFPLTIVLLLTEAVELIAQLAVSNKISFTWAYHIFVPLEYSLFSFFFGLAIPHKSIKKIIFFSIPFFIVVSLSISAFYYHFQDFPGLNINTEGLLLFIYCTVLLFNLEVKETEHIFQNPDIWISLGVLIFYGGTFFYNGIYTKLVNLNKNKAEELFNVINKPLNFCLYSFIIVGLLCLITRRKYITR